MATNLLTLLHRQDPRLIVLICAAAQPKADLVLNVTNLVSSKGKEDWWLQPSGKAVCSGAVRRLAATAGMPPVLVLTEGPTDTRNLRAGLDFLRPDVADLFEFLNRTPKPQQNAAEVTNMAKQFSASEPSRKIVALYDNDVAWITQLKIAQKSNLGKSVTLIRLPDIKTARSYPTLAHGAPPTAIVYEDVNGRACGIEIYLGVGALTDSSGSLIPVRWSPAVKGTPTQPRSTDEC